MIDWLPSLVNSSGRNQQEQRCRGRAHARRGLTTIRPRTIGARERILACTGVCSIMLAETELRRYKEACPAPKRATAWCLRIMSPEPGSRSNSSICLSWMVADSGCGSTGNGLVKCRWRAGRWSSGRCGRGWSSIRRPSRSISNRSPGRARQASSYGRDEDSGENPTPAPSSAHKSLPKGCNQSGLNARAYLKACVATFLGSPNFPYSAGAEFRMVQLSVKER